MADWVTISSLATGAGTLVLAVATFASVRSANRAARVAEDSLLASVRPLLLPSRQGDEPLKVGFADNHWVRVAGGAGTVEILDDAVYLTMSLRNAGNGIAVLDGWRIERATGFGALQRPELTDFRHLTRDLYIANGDVYFWQGAIRDREDPDRQLIADRVAAAERIVIDLLYSDQHGGQRVISRFSLLPRGDDAFVLSLSRQWNVDRPDPRER
ncbi:MAG TPA: hypothetical protein VJ851_01515 [Jatrophihabitans sp.]|nr:hypothetical protein [Jatrophihabitans sp.]